MSSFPFPHFSREKWSFRGDMATGKLREEPEKFMMAAESADFSLLLSLATTTTTQYHNPILLGTSAI